MVTAALEPQRRRGAHGRSDTLPVAAPLHPCLGAARSRPATGPNHPCNLTGPIPTFHIRPLRNVSLISAPVPLVFPEEQRGGLGG